jgi:hypothetical protein
VPRTTIVEIAPTEQAQMLAAVRRARYGYLLALHVLLLCATQRSPTLLLSKWAVHTADLSPAVPRPEPSTIDSSSGDRHGHQR